MDCLMGIDLGSTSLKAVIYDLDGNLVASGSRPTERYNPHPDHPEWTVWQPEQIWGGTAAAIKEAVNPVLDPPAHPVEAHSYQQGQGRDDDDLDRPIAGRKR